MKEVEFIRSPAQGNIYSTSRIGNVTLIGTGNYGRVLAHVNPTSLSEAPLSSIPIGSDIVAIDACQDYSYIIGVAFVQTTQGIIEDVKTAYLNFYTTWAKAPGKQDHHKSQSRSRSPHFEPNPATNKDFSVHLDTIGQKCVQFKLNFIPYHLSHTRVKKLTGDYENVFLLSGSDCRIYVYEPSYEARSFAQVPTKVHFPELDGTFPSIVTRIRVKILQDISKRITLCGCEDGQLRCFIISDSDSELESSLSPAELNYDEEDHVFEGSTRAPVQPPSESFTPAPEETNRDSCRDSLASSLNEDLEFGQCVQTANANFDGMITAIKIYSDGLLINAVVTSSNSPAYVFTDVLNQMFKTGKCLKFSSRWDSVQTACVADIDFDGQLEVVVGTFGCTLLVYKYMEEQIQQWVIVAHRKLPGAIFSLDFFDFHLHVVTACGLHIIEFSNDAYFYKHGIPLPLEPNDETKMEDETTTSADREDE